MHTVSYKQPVFDLLGITIPKHFALPVIHSPLLWLNRTRHIRQDIKEVIHYAKSIIIVGLVYARPKSQFYFNKNYFVIADYAGLRDYHKVLKFKLTNLVNLIKDYTYTSINRAYANGSVLAMHKKHLLKYKIFVDSFPVYEKGYALSALGGTFGKNNLYQSFLGSKIVLGGIATNIPIGKLKGILCEINQDQGLLYQNIYRHSGGGSGDCRDRSSGDKKQHIRTNFKGKKTLYGGTLFNQPQVRNMCSNCSMCSCACPTGVFDEKGFNITKCISYLSIESKKLIPDYFMRKMKNILFGCDICQDVCPFNDYYQIRLSLDQLEKRFGKVIKTILYWRHLARMSYGGFYRFFAGTPIIRMSYFRFKHRVNWYISNILKEKLNKNKG